MKEKTEETQEFALMVLPKQTKADPNITEILLWLKKELKSRYSGQNTSLENRQYSPLVDYGYVVSTPRVSFVSQIEPRRAIVLQTMEQLEGVYGKGILSKL